MDNILSMHVRLHREPGQRCPMDILENGINLIK